MTSTRQATERLSEGAQMFMRALVARDGIGKATTLLRSNDITLRNLLSGGFVRRDARDRIEKRLQELAGMVAA